MLPSFTLYFLFNFLHAFPLTTTPCKSSVKIDNLRCTYSASFSIFSFHIGFFQVFVLIFLYEFFLEHMCLGSCIYISLYLVNSESVHRVMISMAAFTNSILFFRCFGYASFLNVSLSSISISYTTPNSITILSLMSSICSLSISTSLSFLSFLGWFSTCSVSSFSYSFTFAFAVLSFPT